MFSYNERNTGATSAPGETYETIYGTVWNPPNVSSILLARYPLLATRYPLNH